MGVGQGGPPVQVKYGAQAPPLPGAVAALPGQQLHRPPVSVSRGVQPGLCTALLGEKLGGGDRKGQRRPRPSHFCFVK